MICLSFFLVKRRFASEAFSVMKNKYSLQIHVGAGETRQFSSIQKAKEYFASTAEYFARYGETAEASIATIKEGSPFEVWRWSGRGVTRMPA